MYFLELTLSTLEPFSKPDTMSQNISQSVVNSKEKNNEADANVISSRVVRRISLVKLSNITQNCLVLMALHACTLHIAFCSVY